MSPDVHYVFDTNTLISAAMFEDSKPGQAFHYALRVGKILLSSATLEELADVLQREKFDSYVTFAEREEFLQALIDRALFLEPHEAIRACRDPKDDKFLELAVNGQAAYIITGDTDLLILNPFLGITIMTAAKFLETHTDDST